jgi:predicted NUDIX family NTP pyrophosphohydrolase
MAERAASGGGSRRHSAGLLMFRRRDEVEVFLVHPGGPFYTRRDEGAWTIPKGEIEGGEAAIDVAIREFAEETGRSVASCRHAPAAHDDPRAGLLPLGAVRQRGGKVVEVWAFEGDWPEGEPVRSMTFTMEWPPRSGRERTFPEVDRGAFFAPAEAARRILPAQAPLLERLRERI